MIKLEIFVTSRDVILNRFSESEQQWLTEIFHQLRSKCDLGCSIYDPTSPFTGRTLENDHKESVFQTMPTQKGGTVVGIFLIQKGWLDHTWNVSFCR